MPPKDYSPPYAPKSVNRRPHRFELPIIDLPDDFGAYRVKHTSSRVVIGIAAVIAGLAIVGTATVIAVVMFA